MVTDPINPSVSKPSLGQTSFLGLIFLMMGAPHLYAAVKPNDGDRQSSGIGRYAVLVVIAGAIASLVELSVF